jgi:hypothetical protein
MQSLFEGALALFQPVETQKCDASEAMKFGIPLKLALLLLDLQAFPRCGQCCCVVTLPRRLGARFYIEQFPKGSQCPPRKELSLLPAEKTSQNGIRR